MKYSQHTCYANIERDSKTRALYLSVYPQDANITKLPELTNHASRRGARAVGNVRIHLFSLFFSLDLGRKEGDTWKINIPFFPQRETGGKEGTYWVIGLLIQLSPTRTSRNTEAGGEKWRG